MNPRRSRKEILTKQKNPNHSNPEHEQANRRSNYNSPSTEEKEDNFLVETRRKVAQEPLFAKFQPRRQRHFPEQELSL